MIFAESSLSLDVGEVPEAGAQYELYVDEHLQIGVRVVTAVEVVA